MTFLRNFILITLLIFFAGFLITEGLQIRPNPCQNPSGENGTCMFVWDCIKTEGKQIGTCSDGFLIGSCCSHNTSNNSLIQSTDRPSVIISALINQFPKSPVSTAVKLPATPTVSPARPTFPTRVTPPTTFNPLKKGTVKLPAAPTVSPAKPTFPTRITPPTTFNPLKKGTVKLPAAPTVSPAKPTFPTRVTPPTTFNPLKKGTVKLPAAPTVSPAKPTFPTRVTPPTTFNPLKKGTTATTEKYISPSSDWLHPTKRPSNSQILATTKYPHGKPSWRPRPPTGVFSTSRPYGSTFSNYYTPASTTHITSETTPSSNQYTRYTTIRPITFEKPMNEGETQDMSKPTKNPSTVNLDKVTTVSPVTGLFVHNSERYPFNKPTKDPSTVNLDKVTTVSPVTGLFLNNTERYPFTKPTKNPITVNLDKVTTVSPVTGLFVNNTVRYPFTKPTKNPSTVNLDKVTTISPVTGLFLNNTESIPLTKPTKNPSTVNLDKVTTISPVTGLFLNTTESIPLTKPTKKTSTNSVTKWSTFLPTTVSNPPEIFSQYNKTTLNDVDKSTFKPNITWIPFLTTPRPNIVPVVSWTQFSWYPQKKDPTTEEVRNGSTESGAGAIKPTATPPPISPCGIPNPHPQKKVVGGKNSAFGSWPWQVSVRRTSFFGFSSTHRCGGALISRQWVATAGHCVDDLILSQIKIRVGEYDFASVQEPHGYVERGAKKKVVHPRYNFFTYENDLALVQLEEPIDSVVYPHISPICLPPTEESLVGKNATVTGWGRLSEGGVLPSILQEVQVPIISNEKCKNMFLAAGRHEYIPEIFMCAGFEEGGRDSCQGDSGGPLQIQTKEGYWFLAGIISWGIGCAEPNMPGVCTRISKFKDWIVQQVV